MLVSDPSTDKSAASLDVNIGSMSDPKELPGLAHFCEHMCKYYRKITLLLCNYIIYTF